METEKPSPHKGLKKGLYLIPTAFTAANIGMGFLAVLYSIRGFQVVHTNYDLAASYFNYAAVAIGLAILFDTLDGRLARMTNTATEIGVQFDSLADVLTFGIAPIALAYAWGIGGVFPEHSTGHKLGVFVLFVYLMCGAFRLARFNVQSMRPRVIAEGSQKVDKGNFVGLPIPPSAGLFAAIVHFTPYPLSSYGETAGQYYGVGLITLLFCLGLLMVSTIKYTSFKKVGTGKLNIYIALGIAALGMLVWLYSKYVLITVALIYVSHGLVFMVLGMLKRKPTLEELPESDES